MLSWEGFLFREKGICRSECGNWWWKVISGGYGGGYIYILRMKNSFGI